MYLTGADQLVARILAPYIPLPFSSQSVFSDIVEHRFFVIEEKATSGGGLKLCDVSLGHCRPGGGTLTSDPNRPCSSSAGPAVKNSVFVNPFALVALLP